MSAITTITLETWVGIGIAVVLFFGIGGWALVRTLRQETRKIELLEQQESIETYSPQGLEDLRTFIKGNPQDPYTDEAKRKYNECVQALKENPEQFYDWDQGEIDELEYL